MKSLVEVTGLKSEMWNEYHDNMIQAFLSKGEIQILVFYIDVVNDELKLIAQNEMPVRLVDQYSYFLKSHYSQEINTHEIFQKHVQYGTFGGKSLTSLLRLTSGLYAPLFFGNQNWPDSKEYYYLSRFFL